MILRYYICALEHLFVLLGLFLALADNFLYHWSYFRLFKINIDHKTCLVFAPGISDTIEDAIFLEGQCQETTEF